MVSLQCYPWAIKKRRGEIRRRGRRRKKKRGGGEKETERETVSRRLPDMSCGFWSRN